MISFFQTGAVWGFRGMSVGVGSRKSEGQCKFEMVAGVMQVGVIWQGFRLVGGKILVKYVGECITCLVKFFQHLKLQNKCVL